MVTTVPLPTSLDTVTAPPDWLAKPCTCDRPSPVPLPTGLVVKNGSNTRSSRSGAMPVPVSIIASATNSPASGPAAEPASSTTLRACNVMVPPSGMASRALTAILTSARSSSPRSTSTGQILSSMSMVKSILPRSEGASMSRTASMRARRSTTTGINCWRREKASNCRVSFSPRAGGGADRLDRLHLLRLAQPPLQDLRVARHDHQQVVEVVRDAAGELADRLHLLRLGELLARFLERDLLLVLGGDVARERGKADEVAGIVADRRRSPRWRRSGCRPCAPASTSAS